MIPGTTRPLSEALSPFTTVTAVEGIAEERGETADGVALGTSVVGCTILYRLD